MQLKHEVFCMAKEVDDNYVITFKSVQTSHIFIRNQISQAIV